MLAGSGGDRTAAPARRFDVGEIADRTMSTAAHRSSQPRQHCLDQLACRGGGWHAVARVPNHCTRHVCEEICEAKMGHL
jgi:hypothetical protein